MILTRPSFKRCRSRRSPPGRTCWAPSGGRSAPGCPGHALGRQRQERRRRRPWRCGTRRRAAGDRRCRPGPGPGGAAPRSADERHPGTRGVGEVAHGRLLVVDERHPRGRASPGRAARAVTARALRDSRARRVRANASESFPGASPPLSAAGADPARAPARGSGPRRPGPTTGATSTPGAFALPPDLPTRREVPMVRALARSRGRPAPRRPRGGAGAAPAGVEAATMVVGASPASARARRRALRSAGGQFDHPAHRRGGGLGAATPRPCAARARGPARRVRRARPHAAPQRRFAGRDVDARTGRPFGWASTREGRRAASPRWAVLA